MSQLSKAARKVTSKVLGKFGCNITFKKIVPGTYNVSLGSITETIETETIKGILQDVNQRETNALIKDNDKLLIIAASDLSFVPTVSDKVVVASIVYQIIRIYTDENDNENIKYEIYLRA